MDDSNINPGKKWHTKLFSYWLVHEFLMINKLAWPSVCHAFQIKMLSAVSLIFTGHIGTGVYLDGAALALSFANISGTSIIIGMASGIETLCSQAYGARNYRLVGIYFQRAIILCFLVCFPIWALWLNAESILILIHQDAQVARIAGNYLRILSVGKPAVFIFILSARFMQTQNIVLPIIFLSTIANLVNIACHYLFVVYLEFGVEGSAISLTISYWCLAILYIVQIRCSHLYQTSWPGWNFDMLKGWLHYCKYGIPGLIMLCLEWWTFEVGYLIVGAISINPKIEIGIFSVMLNVAVQLITIPIGFSIAATVRVGNLLGENNPALAKKVAFLCLAISIVIGIHFCIGLFIFRSYLAQLFTNDECIIAGATSTLFITALYENFDGTRKIGGGILKGCGRQKIGSIINLFVYQLFGAPLAICLCILLRQATMGYWIGMASAIVLQALLYVVFILCTDWRKVANKAQENVMLNRINIKRQSNSKLISQSNNESSLLGVYANVNTLANKGKRVSNRDLMKLLIIGSLIGTFAIGLAFSISSNPNINIGPVYSSNASINATELVCPY